MKANLVQRKQQILSELRSMAADKAKDGVFDRSDVEALLSRAKSDGEVTTVEAKDLSFVREEYAGIMTKDAASFLDGFLSSWIADQIGREMRKREKEKEREKKIESHIERIDDGLEALQRWRDEVDQRMRAMDVDDKQRVMISSFFNLKRD
ncbi:MAG: hypothetical protein ABIJ09_19950 [Pseudomonadota bacterium]